jgi:hypothetical protein
LTKHAGGLNLVFNLKARARIAKEGRISGSMELRENGRKPSKSDRVVEEAVE